MLRVGCGEDLRQKCHVVGGLWSRVVTASAVGACAASVEVETEAVQGGDFEFVSESLFRVKLCDESGK